MRKATRAVVDIRRLDVTTEGNPDDFVPDYNRSDSVFLAGCLPVKLNVDLDGGYAAGVSLRSCYDVTGVIKGSNLPNPRLTDSPVTMYCLGLTGAYFAAYSFGLMRWRRQKRQEIGTM